MDLTQFIWAQKYRPSTLEEIILPDRLLNTFNNFFKHNNIPNILLYSDYPGSGKTSISNILIEHFNPEDVLYIDGSKKNENGVDFLSNELNMFIKTAPMSNNAFKIVFVDEADGLTPKGQMALKRNIEECSEWVRFIFTVNKIDELDETILSRFVKINFELQPEEYSEMCQKFHKKVCSIFDAENIIYDSKIVMKIIKDSFPDYRDIWQNLFNTYLSYNEITHYNTINKKVILKIIDIINRKNFDELKEFISSNNNINYKSIYAKLFMYIDEFKYDKFTVGLILADWQKNMSVPDKLLNFIGCCCDIIKNG
jgi:DNA polymerase III gamma/tau subunit